MPASLLRSGLLLLLWAAMLPAAASHLVGGELTYRYLSSTRSATPTNRYEVTARVYFNGGPGSSSPDGAPSVRITFYGKTTGGFLMQTTVLLGTADAIPPPLQPNCTLGVPRVVLGLYTTTIDLPNDPQGYTAAFTATARNAGITNLFNSGSESMTISVDLAPATIPNVSPAFSNDAFAAVCLGDTSVVLNNAYDADGDRLVYRLATPNGSGLTQPVNYAAGYSATQPFGARGSATINAQTGLARYLCFTAGVFLLAIDVQEYRTVNGREVLLGTVRRDIQVVVRACSGGPNLPPAFTAATTPQRDLVLEEGQTVSFTVAAADPEGLALSLNVNSVLLDGAGPIDATFNGQAGTASSTNAVGNVRINGVGTVSGTFRLRANCGLARAAPYDVVVSVADAVCGSQSIAAIFRITVTRQAPPTRVRGDSVLCAQSVATYVLSGPTFGQYRWTVLGGRVVGPATGRSVQVEWLAGGANKVTVRGITAEGCPTDSVSQLVAVRPGPAITGAALYCRTANTDLRYTIGGPPAPYQWSIANGTIVSGQGTNTVLVDVPQRATATLRAVNSSTPNSCVTAFRISLDDACLAFYNIITPNGDGQNDVFTIENVERHPNTSLVIFNRWGRQVYQSDNYRNTFGGDGASVGLYYYRCVLPDGTPYKGWFEIMR